MQKGLHILINQKRREFEFFGFARHATVFRGETVGWPQLPHPVLEAYQSMDWALDRSPRKVPTTIPTSLIPGEEWENSRLHFESLPVAYCKPRTAANWQPFRHRRRQVLAGQRRSRHDDRRMRTLDPNAPVVNGRYRATQSGFGLLTRGYIAFTSSHEHNVNNGHTRRTVSRAFRTTCV
jgi:hypothetical protein